MLFPLIHGQEHEVWTLPSPAGLAAKGLSHCSYEILQLTALLLQGALKLTEKKKKKKSRSLHNALNPIESIRRKNC